MPNELNATLSAVKSPTKHIFLADIRLFISIILDFCFYIVYAKFDYIKITNLIIFFITRNLELFAEIFIKANTAII